MLFVLFIVEIPAWYLLLYKLIELIWLVFDDIIALGLACAFVKLAPFESLFNISKLLVSLLYTCQ